MATLTVTLSDAQARFVEARVASGDCATREQAAQQLFDLGWRDYERRSAALSAAIQVGLDDVAAGRVETIHDLDAYFEAINARLDAEEALKTAAE